MATSDFTGLPRWAGIPRQFSDKPSQCSTASWLCSDESRPASSHGCKPRQVRAEMTLSGIPSVSSRAPRSEIGRNRAAMGGRAYATFSRWRRPGALRVFAAEWSILPQGEHAAMRPGGIAGESIRLGDGARTGLPRLAALRQLGARHLLAGDAAVRFAVPLLGLFQKNFGAQNRSQSHIDVAR